MSVSGRLPERTSRIPMQIDAVRTEPTWQGGANCLSVRGVGAMHALHIQRRQEEFRCSMMVKRTTAVAGSRFCDCIQTHSPSAAMIASPRPGGALLLMPSVKASSWSALSRACKR